jgi:hypothetical protein
VAINFALSEARARARASARDTKSALAASAAVEARISRERRENNLRAQGVVIPLSDWLGHNNGPDILKPTLFLGYQWRKAQEEAFRPPSREMGVRWARMAEKLGLTYREFRLVLLEHGRYPTDEDARRIAALRGVPAGLADV